MSNPDTAVTVIEQSPEALVEWNLDGWPEDQFNRIVPTTTLGLANEFIRPVIQVVALDVEDDTYSSRDLKEGHRAPNARGLSKLADAAGVTFTDEVRLDDGSDSSRAYVRVYAELVDPTGMKRRAPGSRDYRLDSQPMTDAQRARAKGYVHEHAATRARHRALRALLSLPQSYAVGDLRKPFAVVRYLPNTQHPEVREAFKAAMVGSIAALYGPEPAKQLAAGPDVQELPEVADDEPRNVTPAPATPPTLPGETLKAASAPVATPEPDWITGAAPAKPAAAVDESFKGRILAAAADPAAPKGKATKPQLETLVRIFTPLGEDTWREALRTGIAALFGEAAVASPTNAQARAIILASDSDEAFLEHWQELGS